MYRLVVSAIVSLLLAAGQALAAEPAALAYPPAPRSAVVEDYHGVQVPDPWRTLEDLDAPATREWVQSEDALTTAYLARVPGRSQLRARLAKLFGVETYGAPFQAGGRYFYPHNTGTQAQSPLYMADGLHGRARLALDPNRLSQDGSRVVVAYVPSHDGRRRAYGVSESGSDWTEWHVRDLATGADLPDVIRHTKYYPPVFARDDQGLYYSAFPAPVAGQELSAPDLGDAVWFHAFGAPGDADQRLLELPGHPDWQYLPSLSEDGRWLVVTSGEGEVGDKGLENVYLLDLKAPQQEAVTLTAGFAAAYVYVGSDAGRLYFLTTRDAPNGRVIAIDPLQAGPPQMQTVVPEGPDAIDLTATSVTLVDHRLIVRSIHDAHSRVSIHGLDGHPGSEITLPGIGSATGFEGHAQDRLSFYTFSNLVTPPTVYSYDLQSGRSAVFRAPRAGVDRRRYVQQQVFYPARDGTRIPMQLAWRKGLRRDARNPVLLYGYGGFGIPLLPEFNPAVIAWLDLGGTYAVANIRGGGEYGESWHQQARRAHKQVVFDDFMAAADWLIAQHYTRPRQLAIRGESNGGLLVGACVTQRPGLFGAAIAGVGVMDMLRFDRFGQGAGWTGEYGSPQDPADFPALYAYSPLHQVHPGSHYPATLVITGDHDTRVMPMHSFKFAAALQSAQAADRPVLLYLEKSSGHGGGLSVNQEIAQNADVLAFLSQELGMPAGPAARLNPGSHPDSRASH